MTLLLLLWSVMAWPVSTEMHKERDHLCKCVFVCLLTLCAHMVCVHLHVCRVQAWSKCICSCVSTCVDLSAYCMCDAPMCICRELGVLSRGVCAYMYLYGLEFAMCLHACVGCVCRHTYLSCVVVCVCRCMLCVVCICMCT